MQPIEFADILSTDLQLAHTDYLTHALCLEGTATLLFNGASFPLQRSDRFDFSSPAHLSRYIRQNLGISASEIRGGEK